MANRKRRHQQQGAPTPKPPEKVEVDGLTWMRSKAPRNWNPEPGKVLTGRYGGRRLKTGRHGPYEVMVLETDDAVFHISGKQLLDLLDGFGVVPLGTLFRVTFLGVERLVGGNDMKIFDLLKEYA